MAELLLKKSSNVVSKKNDVCSVKSNNGLIDLDITPSNNQLLNLCDDEDDLILTNNTKNELTPEDKSLQELIESELALRICSEPSDNMEILAPEEDHHQPSISIKKIMIEPRKDLLDINTEFISAEIDHYNIVEDPYTYRNGHSSLIVIDSRLPETKDLIDTDIDAVFTDDVRGTTMTSSGTESLLDLENDEEIIQNPEADMPVDPFEMTSESIDAFNQTLNSTQLDTTQPYELESEVDNGEPHRANPEDDKLDLGQFVSAAVYHPNEKKSARDMWMDEVDQVHISHDFAGRTNRELSYNDYNYCTPSGFEVIGIEEPQGDNEVENKAQVDVLEFETDVLGPAELLGKSSGILKDAGVFGPLMTGGHDQMMRNEFIDEKREANIEEQLAVTEEVNEVVERPEMVQNHIAENISGPFKLVHADILCRTTPDPILLGNRTINGESTEDIEIFTVTDNLAHTDEANNLIKSDSVRKQCLNSPSVAPLATPDDESSDLSNSCDVSVVLLVLFFFYANIHFEAVSHAWRLLWESTVILFPSAKLNALFVTLFKLIGCVGSRCGKFTILCQLSDLEENFKPLKSNVEFWGNFHVFRCLPSS